MFDSESSATPRFSLFSSLFKMDPTMFNAGSAGGRRLCIDSACKETPSSLFIKPTRPCKDASGDQAFLLWCDYFYCVQLHGDVSCFHFLYIAVTSSQHWNFTSAIIWRCHTQSQIQRHEQRQTQSASKIQHMLFFVWCCIVIRISNMTFPCVK